MCAAAAGAPAAADTVGAAGATAGCGVGFTGELAGVDFWLGLSSASRVAAEAECEEERCAAAAETTVGWTVAVGGAAGWCGAAEDAEVDEGDPGRMRGPAGW